jgi:hypothetical protein
MGLGSLESGVLVPGALRTPTVVQRVPLWGLVPTCPYYAPEPLRCMGLSTISGEDGLTR